MQFLGYLSLVDPGLGVQITRRVAASSCSSFELSRFLGNALTLQVLFVGGCIGVGSIVGGIWVGKVMPSSGAPWVFWVTFYLSVATASAAMFCSYYVAVIAGKQSLTSSSLLSGSQPVVGLLVGSAGVAAGGGLMALPLAYLITAFALLAIALGIAKSVAPEFRFQLLVPSKAEFMELAKFAMSFQLTKLAFVVLMNTPGLLIATVLGPAAVAAYSVTVRLAQTGGALIARAANIAYPGIAQMWHADDRVGMARVLVNLQFNAARVGLWFALVVYLSNERFVTLWVGEALFGGEALTLVVCIMLLRDAFVRSTGVLLFAAGEVRTLGWLSLLEAGLTVALAITGIKYWGAAGAALGPLVATTLVISPYSMKTAARLAGIPLNVLLQHGLGKATLRTVPAGVLLWGWARVLSTTEGWGGLVLFGAGAVTINIGFFDLGVLWRTRKLPTNECLRALLSAR